VSGPVSGPPALSERGQAVLAAARQRAERVDDVPLPPDDLDPTGQIAQSDTRTYADVPPPDPTWQPLDLTPYLTGTATRTEPTLMPREDGQHLLYPGLVSSIYGESESGKSLLVQIECVRLVTAGQHVLFIDNESDAQSVTERLLTFGATPEAIAARFHYVRPEASTRGPAEAAAFTALLGGTYALAVIDGVTDALGLFGYSTKDNDEVGRWLKEVPGKLAQHTGAAVVLVDHVTKNGETRGRFAIGAQAKLSGLTGAAYLAEVIENLGRGCKGVVQLRIAKDRPGAVREHCGEFRKADRTQVAAVITIDSTTSRPEVTVAGPSGERRATDDEFRPTTLMERVSGFVGEGGRPSQRTILAAVPGKSTYVIKALRILIDEGYVRAEQVSAQKHEHVSARPYVEALDERSDRFDSAGNGSEDSPPPEDRNRFPFPIGRETGKRFLDRSPGNGGKRLGNGGTVPSTTDEPAGGCTVCGEPLTSPTARRTGRCSRLDASHREARASVASPPPDLKGRP